jgi:hypothetical protein
MHDSHGCVQDSCARACCAGGDRVDDQAHVCMHVETTTTTTTLIITLITLITLIIITTTNGQGKEMGKRDKKE